MKLGKEVENLFNGCISGSASDILEIIKREGPILSIESNYSCYTIVNYASTSDLSCLSTSLIKHGIYIYAVQNGGTKIFLKSL